MPAVALYRAWRIRLADPIFAIRKTGINQVESLRKWSGLLNSAITVFENVGNRCGIAVIVEMDRRECGRLSVLAVTMKDAVIV